MELTFYCRLPHPWEATLVPVPIPLPVMGTHKLLIEVTEKCNMTGTLDEGSAQTQKQSVHNTTLMARCCKGAYLVLPDGVLPYSSYPFMLHEKFALLWNIHIVDHQISIQSICCTGVQEAL
jgi:hypothetical protein